MVGSSAKQRKEEIRRDVRLRLAQLPLPELSRAGEAIEANVWSVPEIRTARSILLYASMGREVPTDAIAEEAWRRGIQVVYPRCLPESTTMMLHVVGNLTLLQAEGQFGIREPGRDCPQIEPADIDVAFLPGLAWDRAGTRLGRGAGYYDRLFAAHTTKPLLCGLFHSFQEIDRIPREPWDQPLDLVVTEREIVRFD